MSLGLDALLAARQKCGLKYSTQTRDKRAYANDTHNDINGQAIKRGDIRPKITVIERKKFAACDPLKNI